MNVLPYGERAVLVEVDDPAQVPALRAALAARPGVVDAVAGAQTVLVVFTGPVPPAFDPGDVAATDAASAAGLVEVPVVYDGADLSDLGLDRDEAIALHCGGEYTVRFCGFAPGFAYLDGLHERLRLPRRPEPRARVPAGSVAIAGEFTGVYPRASPGGWRLLGHTDLELWDVTRDPPALLTPGTRVRFVRQ